MLDLCTAWWKDIIVEPEWLLVLDPECVPLPPSMAKMTPLLKGSVNFSFTTKHIVLIWAAIGAGASDGEVCETKCDFLASNYLWRIWIVRSAKQHVSAVLLRSLLCQRQKSRRKENYSALYKFLLAGSRLLRVRMVEVGSFLFWVALRKRAIANANFRLVLYASYSTSWPTMPRTCTCQSVTWRRIQTVIASSCLICGRFGRNLKHIDLRKFLSANSDLQLPHSSEVHYYWSGLVAVEARIALENFLHPKLCLADNVNRNNLTAAI